MKKTILISMLIIAVVLSSGCIEEDTIEGRYDANYYGNQLMFNSNLDVARNIIVLPDENTLKEALFGYEVVGIQFAYYDNDTEAPYYIKSLMPFASKYAKLNLIRWKYDMSDKINFIILNETTEMPNATLQEPAIMLIGPAHTDETYVKVENGIVKVYGANLTLRPGKYAQYTDYDLALDKIILVLMNQ